MKKITIMICALAFTFASCGGEAKKDAPTESKEVKKEVTVEKKEEKSAGDIANGKALFSSKGCVACHNETSKIIGPSVKDIAVKYDEAGADLFAFLRGKSEAIVDTDASQVTIMKNNIDTMVKGINDADLTDIVAYMSSLK
ncbi:hypothetical protein KH5_23930 [Urechidicola sp. KH5]